MSMGNPINPSQPNKNSKRDATGEITDKRSIRIIKLLLPIIVLIAGGGITLWLMETGPQARPRSRPRNATLVEVTNVTYAPRKTLISGMGNVTPARQIELRPQVSGEIIHISRNFAPGGFFKAGEELLKIDPTDYQLAVQQLSSEVTKAKSNLQIEKGNQLIARREYELLGEAVSEEEKNLILRQPQLENLKAALEAATIRLEMARVDLERTTVAVPFNAVVQTRNVNLGTRVTPSIPLAHLIGTDEFWVEVSVPVNQLQWINIPENGLKQGALAKIYDPSAWGKDAYREGRVARLAAALEEKGRMAQLLVSVPDPLGLQLQTAGKHRMLMGAYVRVEIQGIELPSAASVDRAHVREGGNIWVMDGQDKLDIRKADIAFKNRDTVFITGGLRPEERLVISDLAAPVQGMPLRLNDPSSPQFTERSGKPGNANVKRGENR